tara:strand:+ start:1711 stop:1854 length:144 start_codon:yes stop_codon:yes gene_type:complete
MYTFCKTSSKQETNTGYKLLLSLNLISNGKADLYQFIYAISSNAQTA